VFDSDAVTIDCRPCKSTDVLLPRGDTRRSSRSEIMVGGSGFTSNESNPLRAAWDASEKGKSADPEDLFSPEIDQLFETLAQWNEYLENHVPYFKEPEV